MDLQDVRLVIIRKRSLVVLLDFREKVEVHNNIIYVITITDGKLFCGQRVMMSVGLYDKLTSKTCKNQ